MTNIARQNPFVNSMLLWKNPIMSVTVDNCRRVILPEAKPGEEFDVQTQGDGVFVLRRLVPVKDRPMRARLVKRNGRTVVVTEHPLDERLIKELIY
jgi:hypothetical protein